MTTLQIPGGPPAGPTAPVDTIAARRRRAEAFTNELGALLQETDGLNAKLAQLRGQRELAERLNPEQAREVAENIVKLGQVGQLVEQVAAAKARRESLERARELYIDLRVRLEFADKAQAAWRSAVALFEHEAARDDFDAATRAERERELGRLREAYDAWVQQAHAAVPGAGIQLL
jgi:hypothetical protein